MLLGLVQGLTEFLPVSSSGHLMLFQRIFHTPDDMLLFDIILHIATLCAVCLVFRKKIWDLIRHPFCKTNICLLIATAITCTITLLFKNAIDHITYRALPFTFLFTALMLATISFYKPKNPKKEVTYKMGIFTGIMQGIAIAPGVSRSGSTITGALLSGSDRETAADFAFLLAIPIIIASFVYELIDNPHSLGAVQPLNIILGFIVAFGSGFFAIKFMLKMIKNVKLYWFSVYLGILSIVLFIWFWVI